MRGVASEPGVIVIRNLTLNCQNHESIR